MATLSAFLSKPPSPLPLTSPKPPDLTSASFLSHPLLPRRRLPLSLRNAASPDAAAPAAATSSDERVKKVRSIEEFDDALRSAKNKLVVVEYAASHSRHSRRIYPFMVELSRTCADVVFLLVMGDESDATRELCQREKIEKLHEEEGIGPDELAGDVLYYGDSHSAVVQLHSRDEVERLIGEHKGQGRLVVLDVGLKHCGPCVKVYPTVVKLSRSMAGSVVFARMNGDENDSCMEFLSDMGVVEVPTFLFVKDGEICGRYVGSGKGELIGEILRYQGVRVT